METVLRSWGNGQGVRFPKELCRALGVSVGARAEVSYDLAERKITLSFRGPEAPEYKRTRRLTMEELMQGWEGAKVGEEWLEGEVGAEVVE